MLPSWKKDSYIQNKKQQHYPPNKNAYLHLYVYTNTYKYHIYIYTLYNTNPRPPSPKKNMIKKKQRRFFFSNQRTESIATTDRNFILHIKLHDLESRRLRKGTTTTVGLKKQLPKHPPRWFFGGVKCIIGFNDHRNIKPLEIHGKS